MPHKPIIFAVTDPRDYDGDVFEVAERACKQFSSLLELAQNARDSAELMARNAEMERNLQSGGDPDAKGWTETAAGQRWRSIEDELNKLLKVARMLTQAASWNPKKPYKD